MIAAVGTVRNEEDIIEASVMNLIRQGVDRIYIADASTDSTPTILSHLELVTGRVVTHQDLNEFHHQLTWLDRLAAEAASDGAEWIIPFDADEFWFGISALDAVPREIRKVRALLWHHWNWDYKYVPAEPLPKIAFRWEPDARIGPGHHSVSLDGPSPLVLEIRHYQYRSFEHFLWKIRDGCARLAPEGRARGDGIHLTRHQDATDDDLRKVWEQMTAAPTVFDPIPVA